MKRAALYSRVSTYDQNPQTQILDLRQMAAQRGYEVVAEFADKISGTKSRRPGLDQMMADARRGRFDVVMTWACDRIARSTRHKLLHLPRHRSPYRPRAGPNPIGARRMTEHSIVLLVCLVVIVVLATLLYAAGWGYLAALARFGELRAMLTQILAHTHNMDLSLRHQRCYKRGRKTRLVTPTKSMAGSHRSGRFTNCRFRYTQQRW